MALILKDRVKQAAAAPGTGTITLGATAAGFQSFASVGNGNTTYFAIVDSISGDWEVNYGVYTSSGTTLTRNATPLSSSTGTLVNFTGAVDVFVTYPSENAVWRDTAGVVVQQSFGAITATSAALTTGTITGAPVNATDIVNKEYADSIASGLNYHQPVNYGSTAALPTYVYNNGASGVGATITAVANGALSLGGGSPSATQRVLVKDEIGGNAPYNGIYTVTQAGTSLLPFILTRATDYDTSGTGTNEIDAGDYVLVISGTLASTAWVQQTPLPITVGTTALTFLQFNAPITYYAGTGLNLSPATTFNISNTGVTATTYGSASAVPVVTFNAQGQATGVTNTTIAIAGSQVSGNISGQAGSVANALTLGTYLTGGTYNGSAAVTATVDATSANTASKVVARDSSGNFSAGTITATLSGSSTSATTATNLAGGAANQIPYQTGSGTTAFATAPSASNQVLNWNGSAFTWSAGTISGIPLGSNLNSLTAGTYLTGTAYNGSAAQTWTVNAASANTASTVVARDASGNFSASTITASLSGNATTATTATNQSGGTVSATTGAFSGVITSTVASGTVLNMAGQSDSFGYNATAGFGTYIKGTAGTYIYGGGMFYDGSAMRTLLQSGNYNSYAPTLTGTGASGTWGINITGSAGSAGSASSVPWTGVSAGARTNYDLGIQPPASGYAGFYFSKSTSSPTASDAGYFLIHGTSDNFGPYTAEGITLVSDANSLNLFARGSSLVAGGNAWVRMGTGTSETFRLMSDYSYSLNSSRAPIFYDSDNTAYYVNPAGPSFLSTLTVYGGDSSTPTQVLQAGIYPMLDFTSLSTDGNNRNWRLAGVYNSYGLFQILSSTAANGGPTTARLGINGSSGYVGIGAAATGPANWLQIGSVGSTGYSGNHIAIGDGTYVFAQYLNGGTRMDFYTNSGYFNFANQYTQMAGSSRAPIFYDSDNTSYYIDPASTSDTALRMRGGALFGPNTTWGAYLSVGTNGNASTSYASVATTNGNLHMDAATGCDMYLNYYAGSSVRAYGSLQTPILYDLNDSAYYVDPASTSNVNQINLQGILRRNASASGYLEGNYPTGVNSSSSAAIYTIGGVYQPTSTTLGNMYGVGYTLGNVSGIGITGNWGFYVASGGQARIFLDSDAGVSYATGSSRAPLFYDYNNTAYYVDPASTSNVNTINATTLTGNINNMPYDGNGISGMGPATTWDYRPNVGYYAYAINYHTGVTLSGYPGYGGVRLYASSYPTITSSTLRLEASTGVYTYGQFTNDSRVDAPIFYDSNDTAFYTDPNSVSSQKTILIGYSTSSPYVYNVASTGYITFGTTSDPANYSIFTELENYSGNYSKLRFKWYTGIQHYASQYYGGHRFYDIDGTQYFGIGVGGNWSYSIYSHRAPLFYDLDNTGYYVDPASTSFLNTLNCYGNVTAYYSSDIKFKTNVRDIPNALETVESIGGKLFDWTDEYIEEHGGEDDYFMRKEDFGVVAQDVLKVFPVAVRTRPDGSLAVDYEKLSALAFAAVASLSTRVKSLEARI